MEIIEITSSRFAVRIGYSVTADVAGNCSRVHIEGLQLRSVWEMVTSACWITGSVNINGTPAAVLGLSNVASCGLAVGQNWAGGGENTWSAYHTVDAVVPHAQDGTGEMTVKVDLNVRLTNGTMLDPGIQSTVTVALPRVARLTTMEVEGGVIGQPLRIRLHKASPDFRTTVMWCCGNETIILAEQTAAETVETVLSEHAADFCPNARSVRLLLRAETYSGEEYLGAAEQYLEAQVPESMAPTVNIGFEDTRGYYDRFDGFVQGKSAIRVRTTARSAGGAAIRSVTVTCGSLKAVGADVTIVPAEAGELTLKTEAVDSRGMRGERRWVIQVHPYAPPVVSIGELYRTDVTGSRKVDGRFLMVRFSADLSALPNAAASYQLQLRNASGTVQTVNLPAHRNAHHLSGADAFAELPDGVQECRIRAEDGLGSAVTPWTAVPGAKPLMDFHRDTGSVGIGTRAAEDGRLTVGMETNLSGHRITNLGTPTASADAATKAYVDSGGNAVRLTIVPDKSTVPYGYYAIGFMASTTVFRFNIPLAVPFRTRPTLRYSGNFRVQTMNGSTVIASVSSMRIHCCYASFVTLEAVVSSPLAIYTMAILVGANDANATIEFVGG